MALDTVQDYLDQARTLLLDEVVPYRYSTVSLVQALNSGILESRGIRPEIFKSYFTTSLPSYSPTALTTTVDIPAQCRMAFLYYICGLAQLRDDETTQDSRAMAFMGKFRNQLLMIGG